MVNRGQEDQAVGRGTDAGDILGFGFNPPGIAAIPGFEAMELAGLHRRVADGRLQRVHRVDFHTITLVTHGHSHHCVDFTTHPCRPGTLLWIRPGQVQSFGPSHANGAHILFTPAFAPDIGGTGRVLADWLLPTCWQLGAGDDYQALSCLMTRLAAEYSRPPGTISPEILQLLLASVMLHIDRLPAGEGPDMRRGDEVYARFHAELERSYTRTRRAEDYAERLGYSVKTLSRACKAATGHPVKHLIDARVILEAQRLLAHGDHPTATIARRLGFSEPTNFGKFFFQHTGTTPGDFRHSHQASHPMAE